jgi:hypothetical protein
MFFRNSFTARATLALLIFSTIFSFTSRARAAPAAPVVAYKLTREDDAFLEDLSRRSFQFFLEHTNPQTGLVADRARTTGAASNPAITTIVSPAARRPDSG